MILDSKCGLPLKSFHSSFRHLDVSEGQQVPEEERPTLLNYKLRMFVGARYG